jgi:secreted Zn-dependent insulinase-like peptidase
MLYHERFNFTIEGYHTLNDKVNALKSVTFRQFKAYLRDNLVGSKVVALIAGNIRRYPAIKTVENFVKRARITGPFSDADRYANFRVVELEPGANLGTGKNKIRIFGQNLHFRVNLNFLVKY